MRERRWQSFSASCNWPAAYFCLAGKQRSPNPNQSAKIRMVSGTVSDFNRVCQGSELTLPKERGPTETQAKGKLELIEVLWSYAGGAANWAPHRAERGPYTGRGERAGGCSP
jgi:hypothetical protein